MYRCVCVLICTRVCTCTRTCSGLLDIRVCRCVRVCGYTRDIDVHSGAAGELRHASGEALDHWMLGERYVNKIIPCNLKHAVVSCLSTCFLADMTGRGVKLWIFFYTMREAAGGAGGGWYWGRRGPGMTGRCSSPPDASKGAGGTLAAVTEVEVKPLPAGNRTQWSGTTADVLPVDYRHKGLKVSVAGGPRRASS